MAFNCVDFIPIQETKIEKKKKKKRKKKDKVQFYLLENTNYSLLTHKSNRSKLRSISLSVSSVKRVHSFRPHLSDQITQLS